VLNHVLFFGCEGGLVYFFGATPDRHLTRLPALSLTHFTPLDAKAKAKQKFISVLPSYSPYTEKD